MHQRETRGDTATIRIIKWITLALVVVILSLVLTVRVVGWNWARGYVEQQVTQATGRDLTIAGDLDIDFSLNPLIRVEDIGLGNAPWGRTSNIAEIKVLALRVELLGLIQGRTVISELSIREPVVHLAVSASGKPNWRLGAEKSRASKRGGSLPVVHRLVIEGGTVTYRDYSKGTDLRLAIVRLQGCTDEKRDEIALGGRGRLGQQRWRMALRAGSLQALRAANKLYPIDLALALADTRANVEGTLTKPLRMQGAELNVSVEGLNLSMLSPFFDGAKPRLPPHKIEAHLTRAGHIWRLKNIRATAGKSDLQGELGVDISGERPTIKADLTTSLLRYDDFANLAAPSKKPQPLDLSALGSVDATINLNGDEILIPSVALRHVQAAARLDDGRLRIQPLSFDVGGGRVRAQAILDASPRPFDVHLEANIQAVQLSELDDRIAGFEGLEGILSGRVALRATGATQAQMANARRTTPWSFLDSLIIDDSQLSYGVPGDDTQLRITARSMTRDSQQRLEIEGGGTWRGEDFELAFQIDPLLALVDAKNKRPYAIAGTASAAGSDARIAGTLEKPLALEGIDVTGSLRGSGTELLAAALGRSLPEIPAYHLEGRLKRDGNTSLIQNLVGGMGVSDISGDLSLTTGRERMLLRADLVSDKLDLVQIFGPSEPVRSGPVIPDSAIDVWPLRALDAEISYKAARIYAPARTFARVSTAILLDDAHLTLDPLKFDYMGGTFDSHIEVSANAKPVHTSLDTRLHKLSLNEILAKADAADQATGVVSGRITLEGDGRSPADFAASADGSVWLVMRDGRISKMLIEQAGLSLIESLSLIDNAASKPASTCTVEGPWCAGGNEQAEHTDGKKQKESGTVNIRCLVADFRARSGVLAARTLIMDTADTKVVGSGTIALGSESVDLKLLPRAKDFSLLAGQAPLHVRGSFRKLKVEVSMARIAFSLLTPIERGTALAADCRQLVQAVRQP
ncbi:MAG: AsmA family protein [Gammaproteobacteria bacterium]